MLSVQAGGIGGIQEKAAIALSFTSSAVPFHPGWNATIPAGTPQSRLADSEGMPSEAWPRGEQHQAGLAFGHQPLGERKSHIWTWVLQSSKLVIHLV